MKVQLVVGILLLGVSCLLTVSGALQIAGMVEDQEKINDEVDRSRQALVSLERSLREGIRALDEAPFHGAKLTADLDFDQCVVETSARCFQDIYTALFRCRPGGSRRDDLESRYFQALYSLEKYNSGIDWCGSYSGVDEAQNLSIRNFCNIKQIKECRDRMLQPVQTANAGVVFGRHSTIKGVLEAMTQHSDLSRDQKLLFAEEMELLNEKVKDWSATQVKEAIYVRTLVDPSFGSSTVSSNAGDGGSSTAAARTGAHSSD